MASFRPLSVAFLLTTTTWSFAADPAPGWKFDSALKRDFLPEAFRQKPEKFYLIEYRWLALPDGDFGADIQKLEAPSALAWNDARAHKSLHHVQYVHPYIGKTYWLTWKVRIALDKSSTQTDGLITKESIAALCAALRIRLDGLPADPLFDSKKKMARISSIIGGEIPSAYTGPLIAPEVGAYDTTPELTGYINTYIEPTIRAWQADHGAPYMGSPNVVQSILVWFDYTPQAQIRDEVAKIQTEFTTLNKADGKELKILDVRTPLPQP